MIERILISLIGGFAVAVIAYNAMWIHRMFHQRKQPKRFRMPSGGK